MQKSWANRHLTNCGENVNQHRETHVFCYSINKSIRMLIKKLCTTFEHKGVSNVVGLPFSNSWYGCLFAQFFAVYIAIPYHRFDIGLCVNDDKSRIQIWQWIFKCRWFLTENQENLTSLLYLSDESYNESLRCKRCE